MTDKPRTSRLRELSRSLIINALAEGGEQSQADLMRATELSRATVTSILADLRADGRITVSQPSQGQGRGRPAALIRLASAAEVVVGVDFGHTHLGVAIADLDGRIIAEHRDPMDVHHAAESSLDQAAAVITGMLARHCGPGAPQPAMIGIGVPGPIEVMPDPSGEGSSGRVCNGTVLPSWAGVDPAGEISRRTGVPAIAENDANLGAIGEHRFGAGRGVDNMVFVKVSSGIGTGMILGGRLYRGARGASGEIGHVQVRADGALCRCGSRGCLETISSEDAALALLAPAHGRVMTAEDLARLAAKGDPGVMRLLSDIGEAIGRVMAVVAANLDPQLVIVGGSMAQGALVDSVGRAIRRYNQPYVAESMAICAATLGERASLMGAIALAITESASV